MDRYKKSGNSMISDGVFSIVAGIILLFLTNISQSSIVFFLAAYAVILGIAQIVAARGEREPEKNTTYLTVLGAYSVVAGLLLMFFMNAALPTIITLVAGYVIITGVAEVVAAYDYKSEMGGYAWLMGAGVVRTLFGLFLLFNTGMVLSTFIVMIAWYAIIVGIAVTVFGYEVRTQVGKYRQKPASQ